MTAVLRGYPFTALLALTIVFLAGVAFVRRMRALSRRWEDAHLPIVIKPDGYEGLVEELRVALDAAGLRTSVRAAPSVVAVPPRLLDRVAGTALGRMVPDRLVLLVRHDLEILVYPSDLAMSGERATVGRARAAAATGLIAAPAWLTVSAKAQRIEDALDAIAVERPTGAAARGAFATVDATLATTTIPFEEWETLVRMRYQIERDLAGAAAAVSGPSPLAPPPAGSADDDPERTRGLPRVRRSDLVAALGVIVMLGMDILAVVWGRQRPDRT
jgi:hypothetical protein